MPHPAETVEELSADKVARLLAAARARPQLADIPWHDDDAVSDGPPMLRRPAPGASAPAMQSLDAVRQRIRDRYISVRFAGVARGAADLENPTRVLKAAWLEFEEGEADAALELLRMAIDQNPGEPALRIGELDLAWRTRDRERFVRGAQEFETLFPRSAEWAEIARAGRVLAPDARLFARAPVNDAMAPAAGPRWRESPWHVVPPLEAVQFHRAMVESSDGP